MSERHFGAKQTSEHYLRKPMHSQINSLEQIVKSLHYCINSKSTSIVLTGGWKNDCSFSPILNVQRFLRLTGIRVFSAFRRQPIRETISASMRECHRLVRIGSLPGELGRERDVTRGLVLSVR